LDHPKGDIGNFFRDNHQRYPICFFVGGTEEGHFCCGPNVEEQIRVTGVILSTLPQQLRLIIPPFTCGLPPADCHWRTYTKSNWNRNRHQKLLVTLWLTMPTKINVPAASLDDEAQPPADEFPEGTPLDERKLPATETEDDTGQEVPQGPSTSPPLADAMELEAERDARGMSANMYDMDYLLQVKPNYPVGVGEHPITEPRKGDFFKTMKGKLPSTTVPKKKRKK